MSVGLDLEGVGWDECLRWVEGICGGGCGLLSEEACGGGVARWRIDGRDGGYGVG